MQDQDGLLEDMPFDADLEGFYSTPGTSAGMVNLQPMSTSFGSSDGATPEPAGTLDGAATSASDSGGMSGLGAAAAAAAAAATAGAVGSALMGGKFSDAQGIVGQAAGTVFSSVGTAAVPTSLQPVKEATGKFLNKAQPWKEFLLPLSMPNGNDGCSRLTTNVYQYQTNYAILFVVYLVISILSQPSALLSIVVIIVAWMIFLKKNDDPEWQPKIGGVQLGPMQRWLLLLAITIIVLLVVAGSTVFHSALLFCVGVFAHGLCHDVSAKGLPESSGVPL